MPGNWKNLVCLKQIRDYTVTSLATIKDEFLGIDSLEKLKKEYEDGQSKCFQADTFFTHHSNMLQHLNNLKSNYEDGTNVFRKTFFTLQKHPHLVVNLDLQQLNHGLDIFHKGSLLLLLIANESQFLIFNSKSYLNIFVQKAGR